MIARMCLSDLHLGDPRSELSDPAASARVAARLAEVSGGEVGTLVLNGDVWDECVPANPEVLRGGLAASVLDASRAFFENLLGRIRVGRVVYVPGNHDLSLWSWYCRNVLAVPDSCTPYAGMEVDPSNWPWRDLFGSTGVDHLCAAYPLFWDKSAGPGYPLLAFTHGHLLDPLVRGSSPEVEYDALRVLGCVRPDTSAGAGGPLSVRMLARRVEPFCLALWARYSSRDYDLSNYVMRRLLSPQSCGLDPGSGAVPDGADQPPPDQGLLAQVPWFLDLMLADPSLPSPVGTLGRGLASFGKGSARPAGDPETSCLVYGHDHLAARQDLSVDAIPFRAVGSGGWTSERDGHRPHTHVLVWEAESDVVPTSYRVETRETGSGDGQRSSR